MTIKEQIKWKIDQLKTLENQIKQIKLDDYFQVNISFEVLKERLEKIKKYLEKELEESEENNS